MDSKPNQEDEDVDTAERVEQVEKQMEKLTKASDGQSEAIASLTGLVEKLVTHHQESQKKEEEKPTAESVKKTLDDFVGATADGIAKINETLEALASGSSSQREEERQPEKVEKVGADNWKSGIL